LIVRPAVFERNILALDVTGFLQARVFTTSASKKGAAVQAVPGQIGMPGQVNRRISTVLAGRGLRLPNKEIFLALESRCESTKPLNYEDISCRIVVLAADLCENADTCEWSGNLIFAPIGASCVATIQPTITEYVSPLRKGKVRRKCSPYLHELALLVIAWNDLHLELSRLFWVISASPNALKIWHSTDSDRGQRKMLREALVGGISHLPRAKKEGPDWANRAKDDIEFILNKIDKIAGLRNSAIHSPYLFESAGGNIRMVAFDFFQSPRAKELKTAGDDLLQVFSRHRQSFAALSSFSQRVRLALYLKPQPTWPERPIVPPPLPKKTHRESPHQRRAK
jgi:hypothetical protein